MFTLSFEFGISNLELTYEHDDGTLIHICRSGAPPGPIHGILIDDKHDLRNRAKKQENLAYFGSRIREKITRVEVLLK